METTLDTTTIEQEIETMNREDLKRLIRTFERKAFEYKYISEVAKKRLKEIE